MKPVYEHILSLEEGELPAGHNGWQCPICLMVQLTRVGEQFTTTQMEAYSLFATDTLQASVWRPE